MDKITEERLTELSRLVDDDIGNVGFATVQQMINYHTVELLKELLNVSHQSSKN